MVLTSAHQSKAVRQQNRKLCLNCVAAKAYNSTYQKCGHWASAFAKAVDNLIIFALQMTRKHLAPMNKTNRERKSFSFKQA